MNSQASPQNEWLTTAEAAEWLKVSPRWVRKRALAENWQTKTENVRGGQQLLIHRSSIAPAALPSPSEAALLRFDRAPSWAQAKAELRRDLIVMIEERLGRTQKTKKRKQLISKYRAGDFAAQIGDALGKVSYPTYMRWRAGWRADGIAGLLPAHKGRKAELAPDVKARLNELALQKPRAAAVVYDMLREFYPGRVPSYSTVLRHVKKVRAERAEECLIMHKGPTAHRHATLTGLGTSDAKAKHPNHMWEIDTTPADIMDAEGKRRKIIGIVDVYTRRYHFRVHPESSGLCVAQTIRSAILAWGLPDCLIMDNGLDYQSKRVQTMCEELGIHVITNPPFCPEKKPHVERAFRTLSRRVFKELTGSTGHDLNARPEIIVPKYTAGRLQTLIDRWVENYWHEKGKLSFIVPVYIVSHCPPR